MILSLFWVKIIFGWLIFKIKIIVIKLWKILIEIYKLMVIIFDNFVLGMFFENYNMFLWIICIFWLYVYDFMEILDLIREKIILKNFFKNRYV